METHERLVNQFIDEYFKSKPNTTGLTKAQGDIIVSAIKTIEINQQNSPTKQPKKVDPAIKKRIKNRNFTINEKDELLCSNVPVVYMDNYFEKINEIHSKMGHPGVTKTVDQIHLQFSCIPRVVVEYYIKVCSKCNLKKRQASIFFNQYNYCF
jgi:hypothetical protein